jgi:CHASE2 domain-containing sensor protein
MTSSNSENPDNQPSEPLPDQQQTVGNIHLDGEDNILNIIQGTSVNVTQTQTKIIQHIAEDKSKVALNDLLKSCTVRFSAPGTGEISTGFFIAPRKILTAAQAVKGVDEQPIYVSWQGQNQLEATVIELFPKPVGLAVLELKATDLNHPCVYLDKAVQSSDELCTFGYSEQFARGGYIEGFCKQQSGESPKVIHLKAKQTTADPDELPMLMGSPLLNWRSLKVCGIVKATHPTTPVTAEAISAETILAKVSGLKDEQGKFHQKDRRWSNLLPLVRCRPRTVVFSSLVITVLVILVRAFQLLQPFELSFYAALLKDRFESPKLPSDRFLVIKITQQDAAAQEARGETLIYSLSNETLTRLLAKAQTLDPIAIGLDMYREQPLRENQDQALKTFFSQSNLFGVCKAGYLSDENEVAPPPGIAPERVGFSDFSDDPDGILRRQLLAYFQTDSRCVAEKSFALVVAEHYLKTVKQIQTNLDVSKDGCQASFSNGVTLPSLSANTGGYQGYSEDSANLFDGCQILLSYSDLSEAQKTSFVTLETFLKADFLIENYKNRIILIGVDRSDGFGDNWRTPSDQDRATSGIVVQTQMINQIIDIATGDQKLIWVLPGLVDTLLILGFALLGGALGWWALSFRHLGWVIIISGGSVLIISIVAFQFNGWVPLMPHFLALAASSSYVGWANIRLKLGTQ